MFIPFIFTLIFIVSIPFCIISIIRMLVCRIIESYKENDSFIKLWNFFGY